MKKIKGMLAVTFLITAFTSVAQIKPEKKVVIVKTLPPITKSKPIAVAKKPLQITSHSDGQVVSGVVQILGTGEPGKTVKVNLYAYIEVTKKKKEGVWGFFKNVVMPPGSFDAINEGLLRNLPGTEVKGTFYKSYTATIDQNGKWYIPAFTSFVTDVDWMNKYYKKYYVMPFAWVVSATSDFNPNYEKQAQNYSSIRLGL